MEYVTSTSFKGPCNEYLTRQDMQKAICRSSPNSILCTSNTVERVFFGSGEKNPKITIFRNFPEKLCVVIGRLSCNESSRPLYDTQAMCALA